MVERTIVNGVFKPTYNWGAPSCRFLLDFGASNSEVLDANLFVLLSFSFGSRHCRSLEFSVRSPSHLIAETD